MSKFPLQNPNLPKVLEQAKVQARLEQQNKDKAATLLLQMQLILAKHAIPGRYN